jgi:hypothetical protein
MWSIYLLVDPIFQILLRVAAEKEALVPIMFLIDGGLLLTRKIVNQGFLVIKVK